MPKFSVFLKTPSNVIFEDGLLKVGVYGKYTFNKYVEGNATIGLWNNGRNLQTRYIDVQNLVFVDFDLRSVEGIDTQFDLIVKASLSEKNSGSTEEDQRYISIRTQRYNLLAPTEDIEFENNKPYSIKVYVKHWTGAPVLDRKTPVSLHHGGKVYESYLDGMAAATFEFQYDPNDDYKFQFKDSKLVLPYIYTNDNLMLNNREYYCRLKLVGGKRCVDLNKPACVHTCEH